MGFFSRNFFFILLTSQDSLLLSGIFSPSHICMSCARNQKEERKLVFLGEDFSFSNSKHTYRQPSRLCIFLGFLISLHQKWSKCKLRRSGLSLFSQSSISEIYCYMFMIVFEVTVWQSSHFHLCPSLSSFLPNHQDTVTIPRRKEVQKPCLMVPETQSKINPDRKSCCKLMVFFHHISTIASSFTFALPITFTNS